MLSDERSDYAEAALEYVVREGATVPGNFYSEVAQVLLSAERHRRIDAASASASLWELLQLPMEIEAADPQMMLTLARRHRLSCYDAAYLAVAFQAKLPLATLDASLRKAADSVDLLWSPTTPRRRKSR